MRFALRLPLFHFLSLLVTLDNARVWAASIYLLAPFASIVALYASRHMSGYSSLKRHAVQSMFLFVFEMMTFCGACMAVELLARANVWLGCLAMSFFLMPLLTRMCCSIAAFIHPDGFKFPLLGSLDATISNVSTPPRPPARPASNNTPTRAASPDPKPRPSSYSPNYKPPARKPLPSSVVPPPTTRSTELRSREWSVRDEPTTPATAVEWRVRQADAASNRN